MVINSNFQFNPNILAVPNNQTILGNNTQNLQAGQTAQVNQNNPLLAIIAMMDVLDDGQMNGSILQSLMGQQDQPQTQQMQANHSMCMSAEAIIQMH